MPQKSTPSHNCKVLDGPSESPRKTTHWLRSLYHLILYTTYFNSPGKAHTPNTGIPGQGVAHIKWRSRPIFFLRWRTKMLSGESSIDPVFRLRLLIGYRTSLGPTTKKWKRFLLDLLDLLDFWNPPKKEVDCSTGKILGSYALWPCSLHHTGSRAISEEIAKSRHAVQPWPDVTT